MSTETPMSTLSKLLTLADGSEGSLLLMAVPFFFLGIVIPAFVFWLWRSTSKSTKPSAESSTDYSD